MSFSPVPNFAFRKLTDISAEFLRGIGVCFLMMDLDNTIAPYGEKEPSGEVLRWAGDMKNNGIELFIVSNNRSNKRVGAFAKPLEAGFVYKAGKPSKNGIIRAVNQAGRKMNESALVGDQVFTDTLAANRAGIVSIAVPPVSVKNPVFALRYALELPFRARCGNKSWRNVK